MRFTLLLVAGILVVGSFGSKFYTQMFVDGNHKDLHFGNQQQREAQQWGAVSDPRQFVPIDPMVRDPLDELGPQNSFVVPKSKERWGRELSNPFVGN